MIGAILTFIGSFFLFLGALGVFRMPDVYNRMQAGTKATTLGSMMFLMGLVWNLPDSFGKLFLLVLFILVTDPLSTHVLARAAHFAGIKLSSHTVIDKLSEHQKEKQND